MQSGVSRFRSRGVLQWSLDLLKELTQCFSGGSCYGPNNTIVKYYANAFRDLLHGPGASNDVIMALHKLEEASGGPNSLVNNPDQIFGGDNSLFHKPAQLFGGENSAVNKGKLVMTF